MMQMRFAIEEPIILGNHGLADLKAHMQDVLAEHSYRVILNERNSLSFKQDYSVHISFSQRGNFARKGKIEVLNENGEAMIRLTYSISYHFELVILLCVVYAAYIVSITALFILIVFILQFLHKVDNIGRDCEAMMSEIVSV